MRRKANHYLTGRDGGRELDLRKFASEGMRLYGRFDAIEAGFVRTRPNLAENLDGADASANRIRAQIDDWIEAKSLSAPTEAHYTPVWTPDAEPAGLDLEAEGIGAVVWCTGFHADFSWIDRPILDASGQPVHRRGETNDPGLYVVGDMTNRSHALAIAAASGTAAAFALNHDLVVLDTPAVAAE